MRMKARAKSARMLGYCGYDPLKRRPLPDPIAKPASWLSDRLADLGDWIAETWGLLLILLAGVILIGGFIALIIWESGQPHISLLKSEWRCTAEHTIYIPMTVGKTTTLTPVSECTMYVRL